MSSRARNLARFVGFIALVGHGLAALAWFWLLPHGFPAGHLRFWSNELLPLALGALLLVASSGALVARLRPAFEAALAFLALVWLVLGVAAKVVFPLSGTLVAIGGAVVGLGLLAVAGLATEKRRRSLLVAGVPALVVGPLLVLAQRAPEVTTRPLDVAFAALVSSTHSAPSMVTLAQATRVYPELAAVRVEHEHAGLSISPLLTFESRSPDGFWTLFAGRARVGPGRKITGFEETDGAARIGYADDGVTRLDVAASGSAATIDAWTRLDRRIDAHLVSWCELTLEDAEPPLEISFSPCPMPIEIKPSDYPVGRPARLAYLDAKEVLHVVEATSGEKGPFHELASGPLRRGEPLAITLSAARRPVFTIVLEDFSAQAGTGLSPTAGWGLPVNAIEFRKRRKQEIADIFVQLAATSVGRGWDSVGHAPGTYRNRMRIESR